MKFLLVPENNSLSHIAKCLALEASLTARGHEVLVAVSSRSAQFIGERGARYCILPDIQENDGAGFPTVEWFRRPQRIIDCIYAEVALLKRFRPDRVLGVFRFTLKASARLAGIPFDSLTCGCMLPDTGDVLGFAPGEPGIELQRRYLDTFYRYAGAKTSQALQALGLAGIGDIRSMLRGDRTFLWDFPEFSPLKAQPGVSHVGPIAWNDWPHDRIDLDDLIDQRRPLAIVAFGTCMASVDVAARIVRNLFDLGFRVLLAAGGQEELLHIHPGEPLLTACRFAPLHLLFPHTALAVCHGGQMTVFEALAQQTPVLVIPFQPEQANNAVCLERLGCGGRLLAPQLFLGNPGVYLEAFNRMNDGELQRVVTGLVDDPLTTGRLAAARQIIERYRGIETLTSLLEAD